MNRREWRLLNAGQPLDSRREPCDASVAGRDQIG